MIKRAVTSRDVAQLAGVSQSLVSRAFTGRIPVPIATREKIFSAAKQLGWSPNALAQGFVNGSSSLVPVITAELSFSWNSHVLVKLLELIEAWQLKPLILYANSVSEVNRLLGESMNWRARGVIVAAGRVEHDLAEEILSSGQFIVSFNRPAEHPGVFNVRTDNEEGGREAIRQLINAGCSRLIIAGSRNKPQQTLRVQGAISEAKRNGIEHELWASSGMDYLDGNQLGQRFVKSISQHAQTGIFAQNDTLAMGFIDALRNAKRYAPDHYKIIGFDNLPSAAWDAYRLSTFEHPLASMVAQIGNYVTSFNNSSAIETSSVLISPDFISRKTH